MDHLKSHKGLAIAHLNVRSLWKKLDSIKLSLKKQYDIDILGLSETWSTSSLDNSLINIEDYELVRLDRKWLDVNSNCIKKGGGTCLFINKRL